jgi:hypothetical protein
MQKRSTIRAFLQRRTRADRIGHGDFEHRSAAIPGCEYREKMRRSVRSDRTEEPARAGSAASRTEFPIVVVEEDDQIDEE